jgi:hypothetical protein
MCHCETPSIIRPAAGPLSDAVSANGSSDKAVKSQKPDGFEKSAKFKARKSLGVRRTALRPNDFEMQPNAGIGLFAGPSMVSRPIGASAGKPGD